MAAVDEGWAPVPTAAPAHWAPLQLLLGATFALDSLAEPLRVWASELLGLPLAVEWAGYEAGELQGLAAADGPFRAPARGVGVLLARLEDLLAGHPELLLTMRDAECAAALEGAADRLAAAVGAVAADARARPLVLCCAPPSPVLRGSAVAGPALARAYTRLSARLRASGALASGRVCLCEPHEAEAACRAACARADGRGGGGWHAPFLERMAHAPYTPAAMSALAGLVLRAALRAASARRKVFAVDCDDTLWSGAVAELGAAGVGLPAERLALQRALSARRRAGVLLCLVTRNAAADVEGVFQSRAAELRLSMAADVLALKAGWGLKSASVRALAEALALPLSTFLFLDDSPAECAEVRAALGAEGVAVVQLPRVCRGGGTSEPADALGAEGGAAGQLESVGCAAEAAGELRINGRLAEQGHRSAGGGAAVDGAAAADAQAPPLSRFLAAHWLLDSPLADGDGAVADWLGGPQPHERAAGTQPASGGNSSGDGGCGSGGDGGGGSVEDRERTELYRQMLERSAFHSAATSADAFVASLNLRVHIEALPLPRALGSAAAGGGVDGGLAAGGGHGDATVDGGGGGGGGDGGDAAGGALEDGCARAAQLSERTNQHNARKLPLTAAQLRAGLAGGRLGALDVRSADRFGDHGHVGLVLLETAPRPLPPCAPQGGGGAADPRPASARAALHVRGWLLSCRTLHVGIEHAMLARVCELARRAGASHLAFDWEAAPRNEPAAAFLWAMADEHAEAHAQAQTEAKTEASARALDLAPAAAAEAAEAADAKAAEQAAEVEAAEVDEAEAEAPFFVAGIELLASVQSLCGAAAGQAHAREEATAGAAASSLERSRAQAEAAAAAAADAADAEPLASAAAVMARLHAIVDLWPPSHAHADIGGGDAADAAEPRARLPRWPTSAELLLLAHAPSTAAAASAKAAKAQRARLLAELLRAADRRAAADNGRRALAAANSGRAVLRALAADKSGRAPLADQLRARLSGALCRHALAGEPCRFEDCPYEHGPAAATRERRAPHRCQPAQPRAQAAAAAAAPAADGSGGFNRPDRGVSVYAVRAAAARPAAGLLYVPLARAERCARSVRFIGSAAHAAARPPAASAGAPAGREPFDHGAHCYALCDETYEALALGLAFWPRALHLRVLESCRGLLGAHVPRAFARAWAEAVALDRAALAGGCADTAAPVTPPDGEHRDATAVEPLADCGGARDSETLSRAHAHLRREIRHGMHLMMQEANPQTYYAHVEHHFTP